MHILLSVEFNEKGIKQMCPAHIAQLVAREDAANAVECAASVRTSFAASQVSKVCRQFAPRSASAIRFDHGYMVSYAAKLFPLGHKDDETVIRANRRKWFNAVLAMVLSGKPWPKPKQPV